MSTFLEVAGDLTEGGGGLLGGMFLLPLFTSGMPRPIKLNIYKICNTIQIY